MTPQALFLYLTKTRQTSEDIAQEVVIDYLQGKMNGAKSLKAWASRRATWKVRDALRRAHGKGRVPRVYLSDPIDHMLPDRGPTPEERAEQRQQIDRGLKWVRGAWVRCLRA